MRRDFNQIKRVDFLRSSSAKDYTWMVSIQFHPVDASQLLPYLVLQTSYIETRLLKAFTALYVSLSLVH